MAAERLEHMALSALNPWARNARTHSKKQIRQIADSIETFGFTNPVLIDADDTILAGHGRVAAANLLGHETVPCVRLDAMTPDQKRAYVLADNKLALKAGWDEEILAEELKALVSLDLDFDVSVTGFDIGEIDSLIDGLEPEEGHDPADEVLPELDETGVVSRPGDIWIMGRHRLICGDSLTRATYDALMEGRKAQMVFTDPPYNVPIDGHVSGLGKVKHREFAMASGEMTRAEFTRFLEDAFEAMADHSVEGSIHFICMDWRHMSEMLTAGEAVYTELKNLIVWAKDNAGMGTFYRSRHELIFAFKKGKAPHINSFELGQHGRNRSNVWSYRGMNSFQAGRMDDLALHPTVKPVEMVADAIRDVSRRGAIVLDAFGGSGSTLIAAHKTGRRGYLIELDPVYVDRIVRRWQAHAHDDAVLLATGERFDDLASDPERRAAGGDEPSIAAE
jgi:DNA modification methylase